MGGEKVSPMQAQWGRLHKYVGPMPTRPTTLWEVGSIGRAYKKICDGWVGVYLGKVSPIFEEKKKTWDEIKEQGNLIFKKKKI